jgi:hypothetical protein
MGRLFVELSTKIEVGGELHAPAALPPVPTR